MIGRIPLGVALALTLGASAAAQQVPSNAMIVGYQQLLSEANDRLVSANARAYDLQQENAKLKAELEQAKKPAETK